MAVCILVIQRLDIMLETSSNKAPFIEKFGARKCPEQEEGYEVDEDGEGLIESPTTPWRRTSCYVGVVGLGGMIAPLMGGLGGM
jgi:hypothetical protein